MNYLYHGVPGKMIGTTLYPLNKLERIDIETYKKELAKYDTRKEVMENFIPTLECRWNDVLHLSAVHPDKIVAALVEAGFRPPAMKFYQIDASLLDTYKATIFLNAKSSIADGMKLENFAVFNVNDLNKYSHVPDAAKEYFREMKAKGEKPRLFVHIPHILYKGSIDISNAQIISTESVK